MMTSSAAVRGSSLRPRASLLAACVTFLSLLRNAIHEILAFQYGVETKREMNQLDTAWRGMWLVSRRWLVDGWAL